MAEITEKYGITQFAGKDYDHWKFRMEVLLDHHEVKECIEEERVQPDDVFKKKDRKCKTLLIQCIANSHLQYVKDKLTVFQMWNSLESVFQRKGIASQLFLRKKLLSMKLNAGESLEKHFVKFEETVRELKSVGAKLEVLDEVCHLLLTLPETYDAMVAALETLEPEKLTMEFVKGKLLDQEMKKKNQNEPDESVSNEMSNAFHSFKNLQEDKPSPSQLYSFQRRWNKLTCYQYGMMGHKKSECRYRRQANQTENTTEQPIAFLVSKYENQGRNTGTGKSKGMVLEEKEMKVAEVKEQSGDEVALSSLDKIGVQGQEIPEGTAMETELTEPFQESKNEVEKAENEAEEIAEVANVEEEKYLEEDVEIEVFFKKEEQECKMEFKEEKEKFFGKEDEKYFVKTEPEECDFVWSLEEEEAFEEAEYEEEIAYLMKKLRNVSGASRQESERKREQTESQLVQLQRKQVVADGRKVDIRKKTQKVKGQIKEEETKKKLKKINVLSVQLAEAKKKTEDKVEEAAILEESKKKMKEEDYIQVINEVRKEITAAVTVRKKLEGDLRELEAKSQQQCKGAIRSDTEIVSEDELKKLKKDETKCKSAEGDYVPGNAVVKEKLKNYDVAAMTRL